MVRVLTRFACKHDVEIDVDVDPDVEVPDAVRGLGKCPSCYGVPNLVPISGVEPQAGGRRLVLDSIMMMPA